MFQQYSDFLQKKLFWLKNAKKTDGMIIIKKKREQIVCSCEVIDKKEISKADKKIHRQK